MALERREDAAVGAGVPRLARRAPPPRRTARRDGPRPGGRRPRRAAAGVRRPARLPAIERPASTIAISSVFCSPVEQARARRPLPAWRTTRSLRCGPMPAPPASASRGARLLQRVAQSALDIERRPVLRRASALDGAGDLQQGAGKGAGDGGLCVSGARRDRACAAATATPCAGHGLLQRRQPRRVGGTLAQQAAALLHRRLVGVHPAHVLGIEAEHQPVEESAAGPRSLPRTAGPSPASARRCRRRRPEPTGCAPAARRCGRGAARGPGPPARRRGRCRLDVAGRRLNRAATAQAPRRRDGPRPAAGRRPDASARPAAPGAGRGPGRAARAPRGSLVLPAPLGPAENDRSAPSRSRPAVAHSSGSALSVSRATETRHPASGRFACS